MFFGNERLDPTRFGELFVWVYGIQSGTVEKISAYCDEGHQDIRFVLARQHTR